ncbi:MAG TPA: hypothetical protein VM734_10730 [Kofleriaceae bacterium]|nr:hypothetical protein [Kofleriaceae bacterium]
MPGLFPALALPPAVRARVALLRERAAAGTLEVTCGGRSMEPVVRLGDRVRIAAAAARTGAVAAFVTARGDLELHRLIGRGPLGWWVHAGDNQAAPALGLVHEVQLVGVADVPRLRPSLIASARAAARVAQAAARVLVLR